MTRTFDIDYVLANISDQDKIALLSGCRSSCSLDSEKWLLTLTRN
jgi:hypothetical protein